RYQAVKFLERSQVQPQRVPPQPQETLAESSEFPTAVRMPTMPARHALISALVRSRPLRRPVPRITLPFFGETILGPRRAIRPSLQQIWLTPRLLPSLLQ